MILLAAVFDFTDGMAARLLKAYSGLGKMLDSLSDLVSFGVLPAVMVFQLMTENNSSGILPLPFIAVLIAVFSAIRLARFTVGTAEEKSFKGLPTPASALFLASMVHTFRAGSFNGGYELMILISAVLAISFLMVSGMPLLALKFSNYRIADNAPRYLVLLLSAVLVIIFKIPGIMLAITAYVLISLAASLAGIARQG
jgi:CDP-diacylglycerol--serine O-phosphatidyltransferase